MRIHPPTSPPAPSSLPLFSITVQTSSQLQNSICMLMREKETSWSHPPPLLALCFSHTFLFYANSTQPVQTKKCSRPVESRTWTAVLWPRHTVSSHTVQLWPRWPLEPRGSGLVSLLTKPSLMAPACSVTPRENGKHMLKDWARCEGGWGGGGAVCW